VVLPAVLLVATTVISTIALGAVKVQASYSAGVLARAAGRGEQLETLAKGLGVGFSVDHLANLVCVHARVDSWLPIDEKSCTRKGGL
jgi:hypothetical protein